MSGIETVPSSELRRNWSTLVACTWGNGVAVSTMMLNSFGVFVIPLQAEFGWSRGDATAAFFCAPIAYFLVGTLTGLLADRYGPRRVALTSIILFALSFTLMATFTGSLWKFYLFFFILFMCGMGTTAIVYTRVINATFQAKRGLALGITFASVGVAALVLPQLASLIIEHLGWRGGFAALGLLAASAWPLVYFFVKPAPVIRTAQASRDAKAGSHVKDALRSRIFWTMVVAFVLPTITASGLIVHLVPLLRDTGSSAGGAAKIASLIGIGSILGRTGCGFLLDRIFAPYVIASVYVVTAIGFFGLAHFGVAAAPFAAFMAGFALGTEVDGLAYLTSRYFGLVHYGVLYAILYSIAASSTTISPVLVGALYDLNGSYTPAFWITVGLLLISTVIILTLPAYARGDQRNGEGR